MVSSLRQDAVIRNWEIIGEAGKNLSRKNCMFTHSKSPSREKNLNITHPFDIVREHPYFELIKLRHGTPPPTIDTILQRLRDMMPSLKERYHVSSLSLFGSWVRGEQTEESDLDILVEFEETPGLISFLTLEAELSDRLGLQVDLVLKGALKPMIGTRILGEALPI